jgi:hypothetical protein
MKNKKEQIVATVQKSNQIIVETEAKSILLAQNMRNGQVRLSS